MANTLKKLLSLAIAVIMVLSLIPAVSAEEAEAQTSIIDIPENVEWINIAAEDSETADTITSWRR